MVKTTPNSEGYPRIAGNRSIEVLAGETCEVFAKNIMIMRACEWSQFP